MDDDKFTQEQQRLIEVAAARLFVESVQHTARLLAATTDAVEKELADGQLTEAQMIAAVCRLHVSGHINESERDRLTQALGYDDVVG